MIVKSDEHHYVKIIDDKNVTLEVEYQSNSLQIRIATKNDMDSPEIFMGNINMDEHEALRENFKTM